MSTGGEDEIGAAFEAAFRTVPDLVEMGSPAKRRAAEKRIALSPDDGRRKRATGRTEQFNVKMKPELRQSIIAASRRHDISMAVMAERAFEAYLEHLKKRAANVRVSSLVAYGLAAIPAAIGVWFVARFAYVTSDTPIDGASNAFLFGMIAVGAYAGPAVALVVASRGRRFAAAVLWMLAILAMLTNWTQTLGAVASRGAGAEAERAKTSATIRDDRARLARIERDLAATTFPATDADAVRAAQAAVQTAERTRATECERRGPHCRTRETDEQNKRDTLAAVLAGKAATDQAAKLNEEAATIRARLATAPAVKEANALGEALGRLLPMSAATAATAQQGLISAIVELLIAAALALPELLRGKPVAGKPSEGPTAPLADEGTGTPECTEEAPGACLRALEAPEPANGAAVARFMVACLPRATGHESEASAIYNRFRQWCGEQQPPLKPLDPRAFALEFKSWCDRGKIRVRRAEGKTFCIDVRLVG